jgi:hypothetical protein
MLAPVIHHNKRQEAGIQKTLVDCCGRYRGPATQTHRSYHFGLHTLQLVRGDQNHSFQHPVVMIEHITIPAR